MASNNDRRRSLGLATVRYGIGGVLVIAGIVLIVVNPGGFGVDGFALAVGSGLSVLLINFLFRLGATGDLERHREEEARRYFDEHGVWPEEDQHRTLSSGAQGQRVTGAGGRRWTLPAGVVTPEDEESDRQSHSSGPRPTQEP